MAIHHLTEKVQGSYHYTIGPYSKPVLNVSPGDTIVIETLDAFAGKITGEKIRPSDVLEFPFTNPLNGPIFVNGAEKGDAVAVRIRSIVPRGPQPRGTTCLVSFFGGLTGTRKGPTLQEPLPERVRKVEISEKEVIWNGSIRLPYEPFIGTIGTSPKIDSISSQTAEGHGGNMDLPDVRPGNTIYLPVQIPGAGLFLGDCHAVQGDGEVCGVAIEFPTVTTVEVDLVKRWPLEWPRVEGDDFIMSVGNTRPMEDAVRIAYMDLISWMAKDYGFEKYEAYLLLSQIGRVRLGNIVDPNYTMAASIRKEYLIRG